MQNAEQKSTNSFLGRVISTFLLFYVIFLLVTCDNLCEQSNTFFAIGILILFYRNRLYLKTILIYLYSLFFVINQRNTLFVPVFLDRRMMYIPVKKQKPRFYLIKEEPKLSDIDKISISFLNNYICKLDKHIPIQIFSLKDNEEKSILISEI
jgi:hypothetical protein